MVKIRCPHCQKVAEKPKGAINRAARIGAPVYCSRECAGLARRDTRTKAQRVAEKAAYDAAYRAKNREALLEKKRVRHLLTYDPAKAAIYRKKRMHLHVEYCRGQKYKEWKSDYDKKYHAEKNYGEFAGAALALRAVEGEIDARGNRYERDLQNGRLNKALSRRRTDPGTDGHGTQGGTLGHAARGQGKPDGASTRRRGGRSGA